MNGPLAENVKFRKLGLNFTNILCAAFTPIFLALTMYKPKIYVKKNCSCNSRIKKLLFRCW